MHPGPFVRELRMVAERRHVLVVDRDRIAGLISKMLVKEYSTDVANGGLKAVDKLRELLPSVLVVDAEIPGSGIPQVLQIFEGKHE